MEQLPNNPEAERNLIGMALLESHIPAAARDLTATDFYNLNYRAAWRAFQELDEQGKEIDHISAFPLMGVSNGFRELDLVDTTRGMIHGLNERVFVNAIKECSLRRYLIRELNEQVDALKAGGTDVIRDLKRKIDELDIASETTGHFRTLAEIVDVEVKPALKDLHHRQTHKIRTGIAAIDNAIGGGLSPTDVLLVAGIPGSGKSAFVLQLAASIAEQGTAVAFLSGEMSDKENVFRLLSQKSGITNLNSLDHISASDLDELTDWADAIKSVPMLFDSRTYDLRTISKVMRGLIEQKQVKVLVIDYIQLLKLDKTRRQDRYERITEVSQEIKRVAMEHNVAIIEAAQFNREGAKSGKPMMHDLEGSSQLEKDTSLIMIIDRIPETMDVVIRVVKGRNTGTCEIQGRFIGRCVKFEL